MEILDRVEVRGTAALNSDVCHHYPQIVDAGLQRGWEWMGHGTTNSEPLQGLDESREKAVIETVTNTIQDATGRPPKGWLGPKVIETAITPDLLSEAGYTYVCDWCSDEQPFPMRTRSGSILAMPYAREVNDIPLFVRKGFTGQQFYDLVCDQFDVLYQEGGYSGRVMCIALHPFLSGHPFRARWVQKALEYIVGHEGVWKSSGGEIADWYLEHYQGLAT
jgi:peptidoglycan/xylan/chitin deacetylase (PgdA/CDA1 family)